MNGDGETFQTFKVEPTEARKLCRQCRHRLGREEYAVEFANSSNLYHEQCWRAILDPRWKWDGRQWLFDVVRGW